MKGSQVRVLQGVQLSSYKSIFCWRVILSSRLASSAWKQGGDSRSNCFHPQLSTRRGGPGLCSRRSADLGSSPGRRAESERSCRSWRRGGPPPRSRHPQASGGRLEGGEQLVWCCGQRTRSCRTFPLGTPYAVSGQLSSARLQGEPCVTGNLRRGWRQRLARTSIICG